MQQNHVTIKAKDGASISVESYHPEDQSAKAILILCHGFGEHATSYTDFAEHLVAQHYACVGFDQRGHGNLPKEKRGVIPAYQSFLDDIGMVTAYIRQTSPHTPLVLYGHSMGGNIAANYLLKRGQSEFACAVLESPWFGLHKKVHPLKTGMAKAFNHIFPNMPLPEADTKLPFSDITSDEEKQKQLEADPLYHNRMSMRMLTGINNACAYALTHASDLSIPTFLAAAQEERIVSNEAISKFYGACKSNATYREYASRHSIHNDVSREQFYLDLIGFLNTHCHAQPV